MTRRVRLLLVLLLVIGGLPILTAASNGGGNGAEARAEHQRIVDFWTHARVSQARPRDFVRAPGGGYVPAARPGGGVVSGSSYNNGGAVDGTVGKVLFAMGGSFFVCSATVVADPTNNSRSIVLTAGHCVFDETGGDFATNWVFIPDYDAAPAPLSTSSNAYCDDTLYGCWTADALVVHEGYATAGGFNDQAVAHDWGFVVTGLGGHGANALVEDDLEAVYGTGTQAISFTAITFGTEGYAFGYPAAGKYKGKDLTYCRGPVDGDPLNDDNTYRMNGCKMTGGSSGGSWMRNFSEATGFGTVFSLNSYGYSGISAMHGPIFNANTGDTYDDALTANANTITP